MRGLTLMELVGLYLLVLGLGGVIGAAFLVTVALGVLAIGVIGITGGLSLIYLAGAREAAAQAKGLHAVGGNRSAARPSSGRFWPLGLPSRTPPFRSRPRPSWISLASNPTPPASP